jgi:glycosyltransferase involved in cell wall biosynthesis
MEEEVAPGVVVSAIVVSYNSKEALGRSLESLKSSSIGEAMEILVVDCGSRDSSSEIDHEVSGITVLRLPRHFGLTKARNIGARTAQGRYLLFLDPDIEVLPETVALLAAKLDADAGAVIACPLLVDREGRPVSHVGELPSLEELYRAWRRGDCWSRTLPATAPVKPEALEAEELVTGAADPRAMLVRAQFLRGMNYFDEKYGQFGSNLQLFAQIRTAAKRIVVLAGARAVSHEGEGLWKPSDTAARADLCADYAAGLIRYARYWGLGASLRMRAKILAAALLKAAAALLTFGDAGFRAAVLTRVLGGARIDGSQTGL